MLPWKINAFRENDKTLALCASLGFFPLTTQAEAKLNVTFNNIVFETLFAVIPF